jgi:CheY-like chemotaxis protein
LFFEIDPSIPLGLRGDPTRLRQIFINLLGNAIKFTEKGTVGLSIRLVSSSQKTNLDTGLVKLCFKISDTGIGIPQEEVERIFEPFVQGDKALIREYGGAGLGLTISKEYIELMGGKIRVESLHGQGSDFIFELPFSVDQEFSEKIADQFSARLPAAEGKAVAVISNDKREELKKYCSVQKMKIQCFDKNWEDAYKALQSSKRNVPDLIFVDLSEHKDKGYLLASKLKQDSMFKNTKIIAFAQNVRLGMDCECYAACFDDYLLRPVIQSEFLDLLKKVFGCFVECDSMDAGALIHDGLRDLSVLVVDDSLVNIELIKAYFETIGCTGDFAVNGWEAIEKIKKNPYAVCFLDLQMPFLNGFAVAQIIRQEISRDLPIVALTAADTPEEKERCREAGFDDFLPKPFSMNDLKDKIISYGRKQR